MKHFDGVDEATLLQHWAEEKVSGSPVVPPITQTSLFVYDTVAELREAQLEPFGPPFDYSRCANPTVRIAEKKIAALEQTEECRLFGSGMGAITAAILSCVHQGSHVAALDTCYGPTRQFLTEYMPKFGVETTFFDGRDPQTLIDALKPNTTCVYLESPGSILFRLQDIEALTKICRERGITTVFDNSYASPLYQKPATMGVDLVVHSATKYLAGHSDLTAGALCGSREKLEAINKLETPLLGAALAPFPGWLLLRGLRTLHLRLAYAEQSSKKVFDYLKFHPMVEKVNYVGDPDSPEHHLFKKQMKGATGLISFLPKQQSMEWCCRFAESLDIFQIGVSWGGFESLCVVLPYKPLDWPEEKWVVRLYCGLESPEDLIKDLEQGFRKA